MGDLLLFTNKRKDVTADSRALIFWLRPLSKDETA